DVGRRGGDVQSPHLRGQRAGVDAGREVAGAGEGAVGSGRVEGVGGAPGPSAVNVADARDVIGIEARLDPRVVRVEDGGGGAAVVEAERVAYFVQGHGVQVVVEAVDVVDLARVEDEVAGHGV